MRLIDADKYKEEFMAKMGCTSMITLDEQPTIDAVIVPRGATNGDMIKTLFPRAIYNDLDGTDKDAFINVKFNSEEENRFWKRWWDAPYREVK